MMVIANNFEYFEKVEGGYFLPEENEQDLLDFINSLNNKIVNLENAIKKEREKTDEVISSKNKRINNLEEQLQAAKELKKELQNIIDNKDKISNLKDEQIDILEQKIELYKEQNLINEKILEQKNKIISGKDELIEIEQEKSFKGKINWGIYGLVTGLIIGLYAN
jgi:vacuolar-type H+-ATPase subunit I/STV1